MSKDSFDDVKVKVEAILFSYGDWISPKDIMTTLGLDSELLVNNSLQEIEAKYREGFSFCVEMNENSKWRMALRKEYEDLVCDIVDNVEIPKPILKVLSIIAYEQPVTKTRLSEILGRPVKQEVGWLYRNKFLSYEKRGIGKYYRVTRKFYDYFKLEEDEDFRDIANKNINEFIQEFPLEQHEEVKSESLEQQGEVVSKS
jgi:segregation and condensation protein B